MDIYVVVANCWDCSFVLGVIDSEPSEQLKRAMLVKYYDIIMCNAPTTQKDKMIDLVEDISVEKHILIRNDI